MAVGLRGDVDRGVGAASRIEGRGDGIAQECLQGRIVECVATGGQVKVSVFGQINPGRGGRGYFDRIVIVRKVDRSRRLEKRSCCRADSSDAGQESLGADQCISVHDGFESRRRTDAVAGGRRVSADTEGVGSADFKRAVGEFILGVSRRDEVTKGKGLAGGQLGGLELGKVFGDGRGERVVVPLIGFLIRNGFDW